MTQESQLQNKAVAVTGGCGFIGSHLVQRLLLLGASKVIVLDSMEYGKIVNLEPKDPRVEVYEHKLGPGSRKLLRAQLAGADYLFHLAAEKHNQSIDDPQRVIEANINGTYELLTAAVEANIKRVVFSSSLYAHGRTTGEPLREDQAPEPKTIYGMTKLAGENICRYFNARHGLKSLCLRYFFVYGPRQYANTGYKSVIVKTFERLLAGEQALVNGGGKQELDYIYVSDIVDATIAAMESTINFDILNIGSGKGIQVDHLIRTMMTVANIQSEVSFAPPDQTHGTRRIAETGKAKRMLGFEPVTGLEEGLLKTFEWISSKR
jgi:UDP-glucose 4-epimerase